MTTYQQDAYTNELRQQKNFHSTGKVQGLRQNANLERYMFAPVTLPVQDRSPMEQASIHVFYPYRSSSVTGAKTR